MANEKNLRPQKWKKGQSGNPKGRPPVKRIEKLFQDFLYEVARSKDGQERQRMEVILHRLFANAANGDHKAIQTLLDRAFGKPKQEVAMVNGEGETFKVEPTTAEEAARRYQQMMRDVGE